MVRRRSQGLRSGSQILRRGSRRPGLRTPVPDICNLRHADGSEIIDLMLDEQLSAVAVVETGTTEFAAVMSYMDSLEAALPMLAAE